MVVVSLAMASICFAGECHPALVGNNTPAGTFTLSHQSIDSPGYGGDLLVFHENRSYLWAIHRVYTLKPQERREERLRSSPPERRRSVTHGCINVMPEVYDKLIDCCSRDLLVIRD
jgi:hypothetical protein